ncbi:hypothetical protein ACFLW8_02995 [Chloroflexota bacterium]
MAGRISEEPQITLGQKHFPQPEALQLTPETVFKSILQHNLSALVAQLDRTQMQIEPQAATTEDIQEAIETGATYYPDRNNLSHTEHSGAIKQVDLEEHKDNPTDVSEETVDLVIPPLDKASQLFGLVCEIEGMLGGNSFSTIGLQQVAGSWKRGVTIKVVSNRRTMPQLLDDLKSIPGVEKIEERQTAKRDSPGHLDESQVWPNSKARVKSRLLITPRQASMAPQEPETNLN